MEKPPKVSVILPTHNGGKFITRAVESVLKQSFKDLELIVVDDGSSDHTSQIIEEFKQKDQRVFFLKNKENLGIQKTLNKGLAAAKGEYIARIDDDDEWVERTKLEEQVLFMDANPDYELIGTGVIMVDEGRNELFRFLQPVEDSSIRKRILYKSCFMHSAVLFRKATILSLGGYSEDGKHRHIEDYNLWLHLGKAGKLHNLPMYGIKFMLRDGAISAVYKSDQFKNNVRLVKEFRRDYPGAFGAIIFSYVRLFGYEVYKLLPFRFLKHLILRIYKSA